MFAGKLDGNHISVTPSMLGNLQNPVESDNLSTGTRYKALDHHTGLENKAASVPIRLQQNLNSSVGRNNGVVQPQPRLLSDAENIASQSQQHLWQRSCPAESDVLNEQEDLAIEGGTIQLSSVYSQGWGFMIHLILAIFFRPQGTCDNLIVLDFAFCQKYQHFIFNVLRIQADFCFCILILDIISMNLILPI